MSSYRKNKLEHSRSCLIIDLCLWRKINVYSSFSKTHNIGNIGIIANLIVPYICSFLLYLYYFTLVNVKLDVHEDYILKLQISLVLFISNGKAKTKLVILAFLYCGEFVKNSLCL